MALKVKPIQLWWGKMDDKPGGTSGLLRPLHDAKVDLEFVLARRTPEDSGKGVIFVAPIEGVAAERAANLAGLNKTWNIFSLRVEGTNEAGTGHTMAKMLSDAHLNLRGMSATAIGNKFVCYFSFDSAADAARGAELLRANAKAGGGKRKRKKQRSGDSRQ